MSNIPYYKRNFPIVVDTPNIGTSKSQSLGNHNFVVNDTIIIVGFTFASWVYRFNTVTSDYEVPNHVLNKMYFSPIGGPVAWFNNPIASDSSTGPGNFTLGAGIQGFQLTWNDNLNILDYPPLTIPAGAGFRIYLETTLDAGYSPTYAWAVNHYLVFHYLTNQEFNTLKLAQFPMAESFPPQEQYKPTNLKTRGGR